MENSSDRSTGSTPPDRLFADQIQKQYEHTAFGTAATLTNGAILSFILRAHVDHSILVLWMACALAIGVCRLILHRFYRKSLTQQASNPRTWNNWFIATLFLSGVLWGSTAFFLFPTDSIGHQVFIAFVAGGMVAGAVGIFTSVLANFFIFSVPAVLPISFCFFILGSEIHIAMGAILLFFLLIMSLSAARMHRNIFHLLSLKYERTTLIASLQEEVRQRKEAQKKLHRQKEEIEETVTQRTTELKKINERLSAILNYAPIAIWALDQQGHLTFSDGRGLEKMGFKRGKDVGSSAFSLFADNKKFIHITQRVLTGEFVSDTIVFNRVYFEVRYQPLLDKEARLVGAIGVAFDVTEQIEAKEALGNSKKKLQELVENINDVLYTIDRNGIITYISPVIESVLGYRPDELIGNCFFNYADDLDRARLKRTFNRAIKFIGRQIDYRFITNSGETKWCRVSSRPISDGNRNVGIQGVLVDIDWSKRLEEQLQRSQKMEALGTLAGGVAHDLNNILSGIVSYPELLLMDLSQDSPLRRPLTIIQRSGENAAAIVQDLLTLARRGVPTHECLDLNYIVKRCLESPDIESLLHHQSNIRHKIDLQSDLFNINGSSIHIFKSISNLISNAVEAMPKGGDIEIITCNRYTDNLVAGFDTIEEGEYVVLSISDTGVGIAERDRARIFEPFYTTKVMGKSGSGLGMAVVWGTVKDHKGYIDIQSTEGGGTRFDLYFPSTREALKKEQTSEHPSDFTGNGEFILVVDDIPAQREIATSILDRLGYRSKSVASGEQAIEYLRDHTADLLILDMILDPGIDGYETYRKIKNMHANQKAIITSGFSETARVRKTIELGAGRYIKKPYTLTTVGLAIKEELRKNQKSCS